MANGVRTPLVLVYIDQFDRHFHRLSLAQQGDLDLAANSFVPEDVVKIIKIPDRLSIDARNNIAQNNLAAPAAHRRMHEGLGGTAPFQHILDDHPLDAKATGDAAVKTYDTKPRLLDLALLYNLVHHPFYGVGGDAEAYSCRTTTLRKDHGVHGDQKAATVEQRPPGIAGVD